VTVDCGGVKSPCSRHRRSLFFCHLRKRKECSQDTWLQYNHNPKKHWRWVSHAQKLEIRCIYHSHLLDPCGSHQYMCNHELDLLSSIMRFIGFLLLALSFSSSLIHLSLIHLLPLVTTVVREQYSHLALLTFSELWFH
jgi:hypothetical protein